LRDKLIKIGAKAVHHACDVTSQLAEVAASMAGARRSQRRPEKPNDSSPLQ
jgi:hypothetical protein